MDRVDELTNAVAATAFPTPRHAELALALGRLFAAEPELSAILLGGSLARGAGTPTSDLDLLLLIPGKALPAFVARDRAPKFAALGASKVEPEPDGVTLDFGGLPAHIWMTSGELRPRDGGQILDDPFELEVAALYVNARPLLDRDGLYGRLRTRFVPFYGEALRQERLKALAAEMEGHCREVERLAGRGLHFAGLQALLTAFRAFVLGLHLSRRRYPLDLLKHLEAQVADGLGRPDLLPELRSVLALPELDGPTLKDRAERLRRLWEAAVCHLS